MGLCSRLQGTVSPLHPVFSPTMGRSKWLKHRCSRIACWVHGERDGCARATGHQRLFCEPTSGPQKEEARLELLDGFSKKKPGLQICGFRWKFLERSKECSPRDREMWVQTWAVSLISCETLGELLNFSGPQFPHL